MTRLLERLQQNDESLTHLLESDLKIAFQDGIKVIEACRDKGKAERADSVHVLLDFVDHLKNSLKGNTSVIEVSLTSETFLGAVVSVDRLQNFSLELCL